MTQFKPITLEDKKIITSYTLPYASRDCDYSFANLCCWDFINNGSYAVIDNHLVIRFMREDSQSTYLMPVGKEMSLSVIGQLSDQAAQEGQPLRLQGVLPEMKDFLDKYFPTLFEYTADRNYFEYIYSRQELAELKGKNYQPKRNHVNKFQKEYPNYRYALLTPEILPQCLELEARWYSEHDSAGHDSLDDERRAMTYAIEHYNELGLSGGAIWIGNEMAAFTFGAPINENTFGVHMEKANVHLDGAYSIINREFAAHLPEQYIYLNREEDLGIPGLRQAKQSYHPVALLEKCIAIKTD